MGSGDSMTCGGVTVGFGTVPASPMRVFCGRAGAGLDAGAGGTNFVAAIRTGGNGTAAVTPISAMEIVNSPMNTQSNVMAAFDIVRRRVWQSRIATRRVSSWDGCAMDTAANDKDWRTRRLRTI